ncbi:MULTISPECIES: hypothetical protein [Sphingomonas]|uniref:Uncharacterized protein n=1 Tax=Sphingomonas molluscorum TaxID=418184 RepID=A0ABU8Q8H5_9SPHN|nr:hypothetical protein [Sphingomonas sp. JUb134]MBM7407403.1 hypothetical protein [Sphingomonas sp. JUb134]
MAETVHTSRRVNNRFGEGTSPRLRQIREGLDALGIDSDSVLHHNMPRLFYACELGYGSRSSLLGLEAPIAEPAPAGTIAAAWRRRWLMSRITRTETLEVLTTLGPRSVALSLRPDQDPDLFAASF